MTELTNMLIIGAPCPQCGEPSSDQLCENCRPSMQLHYCQSCQRNTRCQEYKGFWFCLSRCWRSRKRLIGSVEKAHNG